MSPLSFPTFSGASLTGLPLLAAMPIADLAIVFVVGLIATATALLAVTRRNPLYAAAFLIVFFIAIAVLYFGLAAPFVGILQILVYAGAIMVLYTFIIMLLDLTPPGDMRLYVQAPTPDAAPAAGTGKVGAEPIVNGWAFLVSFGVFLCISVPVLLASQAGFFTELPEVETSPDGGGFGSGAAVGEVLLTKFVLPFEVVSVLLLTAAIAGVVLAKRHITDYAEDLFGLGKGLASSAATAEPGVPQHKGHHDSRADGTAEGEKG